MARGAAARQDEHPPGDGAQAAEERVTFALLMWSEGSASEGVVLLKVRASLSVLLPLTDGARSRS